MNIADNPISKPHLGDIIVAMLAYLEIRHLRLAPRYVIQIRPSIFKGVSRIYALGRSATAVSKYISKVNGQAKTFL